MKRTVLLFLLIISGWCRGADWNASEGSWTLRAFPEPWNNIAPEKAHHARLFKDKKMGDVLELGPWYAGRYSLRYDHKDKLPVTRGVITGMYKTEGLLNNSCAVIVHFYKGRKRLAKRTYPLEKADDWTRFNITVRCPPPAAETMRIGVGLTAHTRGKARFAQIAMGRQWKAPQFPEQPGGITRPKPPAQLKKGKYFSLQKHDGTWWFATPDGKPWYSLGVDGMTWLKTTPQGLKQGLERARLASEMGFVSGGGWSNIAAWSKVNEQRVRRGKSAFPVFRNLVAKALGGGFEAMKYSGSQIKSTDDHAMPDPFDPGYEQALRKYVRRQLDQGAKSPWMVGWCVDNEVILADLHRRVWSTHCSKALIAYLKKKYGSIQKLNAAWGRSYESFEKLREAKPDPYVRNGPMFDDFWAFRKEIIKQWVKVALAVIHEEDPGRLVFCNRFARNAEADWEDLIELFAPFDAIATNQYPWNLEAGLNKDEIQYLKKLHEKTGKPVLVTEWSVPAMDSELYNALEKMDWSFDKVVKNQSERAAQAAQVTIDMYNLPFVVGAHWFMWSDVQSKTRRANRGLTRPDGAFWKELTNALTKANSAIHKHQEK